ncbi:hypothetical protein BDQ17DRAFT_1415301 [Cyathus striatus]|nr:hypothetical protein BDQ17DRAFT_1415301 [Cyathus striatus]
MSFLCHMITWSEWDRSKWSKTHYNLHETVPVGIFQSNSLGHDISQSNEKGKTALMQECGDYTKLLKVLQDLMGTVLEAREGSREIYEVVSRVKGLPRNTCFDGCEWLYTAYFFALSPPEIDVQPNQTKPEGWIPSESGGECTA